MQTITFTPKENNKGIYVKCCIPGNIYKCVGGFEGKSNEPQIGLIYIATMRESDRHIIMQQIGNKETIANQYWKMEELENVTISY